MLRKMCRAVILRFLCGNLLLSSLYAQLPPNQPEQDCINAIPICADTIMQDTSYVGGGLNPEEINSAFSCLSTGEQNDVWYIFTVQQAGLLNFTLTPNDLTDDYDYAVYNLTDARCSDIRANPELEVSCNFFNAPGPTGPNGGDSPNSEAPFAVFAGETYVINVSNFDETNDGYMLDFRASTAVLFDDNPAEISDIAANCEGDSLLVKFTENIRCENLSAMGFTLIGPEGEVPITGIRSSQCENGAGFVRDFALGLGESILDSAAYTLQIPANSVEDNCGNSSGLLSFTDTISTTNFMVEINKDTICQGDTTILRAFFAFDIDISTYSFDVSPLPSQPAFFQFGEFNIVIAPDTTTTYTITATRPSGCSFSAEITVEVISSPVLALGGDAIICGNGPGVILEGTVSTANEAPLPFDYEWSPSAGLSDASVANPFARPDTTTTYTATVTAFNGCTNENQMDGGNEITVFVRPIPIVEVGADTSICQGDTIMLSSTSSVQEGITYAWTPLNTGFINDSSSASPLISPNFTTTYFLVGTANGCPGPADSITVTVNDIPTISAGEDRRICLGDSVNLQGLAFGGSEEDILSFEWSPASGLLNPFNPNTIASPDTTQQYGLRATSEAGCSSDIASVEIEVASTPIASIINPDTTLCLGDTISLLGSAFFTTTPPDEPLTFTWEPADDVLSIPTSANISISPPSSLEYVLIASIAGSCPTQDTIEVEVVPNLAVEIMADTNEICQGDTVSLMGIASLDEASFQWFPAGIFSNDTISNPFSFPESDVIISLASSNGVCTDTAQFEVRTFPTPSSNYFSTRNTGCVGLAVTFSPEDISAAFYIWDFGDGSAVSNEIMPMHIYDSVGVFPVSLTAVGERGCSSSNILVTVATSDTAFANAVSNPPPSSDLFLPVATVNFTDFSENGIDYLWSFGDGQSDIIPNPVHRFTEEGSFRTRLIVTDINGCVDTLSLGPFNVLEPTLFIPNVFSPNDDGINDVFKIQYEGAEVFQLDVFNRWGERYFQSDASELSWDGKTEGGEEAGEGVYYFRLKIGGKDFTGNVTLLR